MNVLALTSVTTDVPWWITREVFFRYFDQKDFLDRDVDDVQSEYRSDWLHFFDDGTIGFYIPVVSAIRTRTDLIGTRHRLAVLLSHLEELPVAFAMGHLGDEARDYIDSIPKRALDLSEPFWIPDLPILEDSP